MKRSRSSDSLNFTPQFKVHVTQKTVDLGVKSDHLMQQVYDKTLNYLKQGAKVESPQSQKLGIYLLDHTYKGNSEKRRMRQMILNNNLQLQASKQNGVNEGPIIDMCECGQIINSVDCATCRFCTLPLCQECSFECFSCNQIFCKKCSLTMYDQFEHQVCLDCLCHIKR